MGEQHCHRESELAEVAVEQRCPHEEPVGEKAASGQQREPSDQALDSARRELRNCIASGDGGKGDERERSTRNQGDDLQGQPQRCPGRGPGAPRRGRPAPVTPCCIR